MSALGTTCIYFFHLVQCIDIPCGEVAQRAKVLSLRDAYLGFQDIPFSLFALTSSATLT